MSIAIKNKININEIHARLIPIEREIKEIIGILSNKTNKQIIAALEQKIVLIEADLAICKQMIAVLKNS